MLKQSITTMSLAAVLASFLGTESYQHSQGTNTLLYSYDTAEERQVQSNILAQQQLQLLKSLEADVLVDSPECSTNYRPPARTDHNHNKLESFFLALANKIETLFSGWYNS